MFLHRSHKIFLWSQKTPYQLFWTRREYLLPAWSLVNISLLILEMEEYMYIYI